jgi:hypothetical protein
MLVDKQGAHTDTRTIVTRTLFSTLHMRSPRWHHCSCQPRTTRTFSPLAAVLPERTTPELMYLESKFEQCGREWLLVTPRSASSRATGLEAIDVPGL